MGKDYLRVRVPATSANLGAGFDVFGIALGNPADIIEIEKSDKTIITVTGRDSRFVPVDPKKNTAGIVASLLEKQVKIRIQRGIPLSSGLGSSAAPAAGVAFALNEMFSLGLSREELVRIAAQGEKAASGAAHADNVAPAIYGGFVIVHKDRIISLYPENIGIVAVHPEIIVSTRTARAILPRKLSLPDISFNMGNAASMV
ncbi:MAG: homoserine kinase, partial [Candidatus Methanoperedens sp.]|nr:homoserine kinase [Candidatus Methanoperedens sp.]